MKIKLTEWFLDRTQRILSFIESYCTVYLILYFALFSVGLCYVVFTLSPLLTPAPIQPLPGVIYYFHDTQPKLISFAFLVPILFFYWAVFALLLRQQKVQAFLTALQKICGALSLQLMWGILSLILIFQVKVFWGRLLLLGLFALPVWKLVQVKNWYPWVKTRMPKLAAVCFWILMGAMLIRFGVLFGEFVFGPVRVIDEYPGVYSVFLDKAKGPINEAELFETLAPEMSLYQKNPYCLKVAHLPEGINDAVRMNGDFINYYVYAPDDSTLCLNMTLPALFKLFLQEQLTAKEFSLVAAYSEQLADLHSYSLAQLSKNVDFLNKEVFQYLWQVQNRGFLHHHNHLFGSAYQFVNGRPANEIFMQYGSLHTMGLGLLLKAFNRVDYGAYIHFYYCFYFIYFAGFLAVIWFFLRDKWYVLTGGLLALAGWLGQTYLYLYLGPGTNPVRYGLYLAVAAALFIYAKRQQLRWLVLAVVSAWAAVVVNLHFGLFSVISLLGVLSIKIITNGKKWSLSEVLAAIVLLAGTGVLVKVSNIGTSPINSYFFSGLLGFPYANSVMVHFFLFISVCYILLVLNWKKQDPLNYAFLFMTFFTQGAFLYYLRSAGIYHFYAMSSIFVLQGLLSVYFLMSWLPKVWRQLVCAVLVVSSLFCACWMQREFHFARRSMKRYIKNTQFYKWDFPGTQFYSAMDPELFRPSVELLEKYGSNQGIYIISRFDNMMPMLAQTYSRMPFIDVQWYLTTSADLDASIQAIKDNKPEYLFVDANIEKQHRLTVIPADYPVIGHLHQETLWRAERMNMLKIIFHAVSADYELVETSPLLNVYRRRGN